MYLSLAVTHNSNRPIVPPSAWSMSAPLIAPLNAHLDHLDHSGSGSGTTHGHQSNEPARPRMTLPSSASSTSSYSILSPPRSVLDVSSTPHLGSSHSESEPHFPGAWVDTAPGTPAPAPLKDNRDNFAEQMKVTNLTERDVPRTSFHSWRPYSILINLQQGAAPASRI